MFRPYRTILSKPGALRFSAAGLIARAPMSMVGLGIVLMISTLYGSYGLAGRVSAVNVLTSAVVGPTLARLIDRRGQAAAMRPVLAIGAAGLVGLLVAGLLQAPEWVLYLTAVPAGLSTGPTGAMVRSRWNHALANPRDLHTAYSLESALDEVLFIIGPALTTTLATSVAPTAGLILPLLAAVGGGYWFLSQRATEPPALEATDGASGAGADGASGAGADGASGAGADGVSGAGADGASGAGADEPVRRTSVLRSGGMLAIVIIYVAVGSLFGATDVATVAFSEEHGNKAVAGLVLGVFALGSFLAGLGYGARHWASPPWRRFVIGILALAVGASAFFFVTSIPMLAVVMFLVGFTIAPTIITGNALVQQLVPRERLTEGLAWVGTAMSLGVSVGASLAGSAIDGHGAHGGFLVVMASAGCAAVAAVITAGMLRARRTRDDAEPVPIGRGVAAG